MSDHVPGEGERRAEYRLLKGSEIRLLRVALGAWDDQVSCTIHYVPLDERPQYVALSYTWGNPSDQVDILLDGRRHRATRSLFTALRRFRQLCAEGRAYDGFTFSSSADETTYIWADALCINQADGREKVREIPRMREVYTLCSRVCAWLGENDGGWDDDAGIKDVLEMIERWLEPSSFSADIPRSAQAPKFEDVPALGREIDEYFGPRVETLLDLWCELSSRAWFQRSWVIQEAALPASEPILMAGGYLFAFDGFTRKWVVILNKRWPRCSFDAELGILSQGSLHRIRVQAQNNPIQAEGDAEHRWLRFGRVFTEAIVRSAPSRSLATVPHDHLYSLIGICGGGELLPPDLAPDYHKPFPLVCEDYARCVIKATGSVAILGRIDNRLWVDYQDAVAEKLPSWVPDFREAQDTISVEGDMQASNVAFLGPSDRLLKVRGFDVGKITDVFFSLQGHDGPEGPSFSERLRHHHRFLEGVARERNVRLEDAVASWLESQVLGFDESAWRTLPALEDLQAIYNHYLHQDEDDKNSSRAGRMRDSYIATRFVEIAEEDLSQGTRLIVQGGMTTQIADNCFHHFSTGDRVVALSGCRHPFIITPVPTDEGPGYVLKTHCILYDGAEMVIYTADSFSQDFCEDIDEDFLLV